MIHARTLITPMSQQRDQRIEALQHTIAQLEDELAVLRQERTPHAVEENGYFLRRLLDASFANISIIDLRDERNVYANRAYLAMVGYTREELDELGPQVLAAIIQPEQTPDIATRLAAMRSLADGEVLDFETGIRTRDGSLRWVQVRHSVFSRDADGIPTRIMSLSLDITERKAIEQALRASEARFRAMVEHSWEGLTVVSANGTILYSAAGNQRLLGYAPHERLGHNSVELIHPDDLAKLQARLETAARIPDSGITVELRLRHKDGRWIWVELTGTNMLNDPNVSAIIMNFRDISERKEAERQIQERLATEELVARISSKFVNLDPTMVDIALNAALEAVGAFIRVDRCYIFQYDDDPSIMHFTHEWCAPGAVSQIEYLVRISEEDYPWLTAANRRFETTVINRLGDVPGLDAHERRNLSDQNIASMISVPLICAGVLYGGLEVDSTTYEREWTTEEVRLLRSVADVIAAALQYRKTSIQIQSLAAFPEHNPNMVLEFDAEGVLQYANAAATATLASFQVTEFDALMPATAVAIMQECLAERRPRLRLPVAVGNRTLSWSFYPIYKLQIVHAYGVEITDRLRIEADLRQAQKMEAIGRLAGGVAHDFNNLLTVILSYSELLLDDHSDPRDSVHHDVAQIRQAAQRATALTRQLLAFSRKQVLEMQVVNLNEVITGITIMLRRLIGEHIELRTILCDDLGMVHADVGQLEQVIVNLALNARDAMPRGGVLTIETNNVAVDQQLTGQHGDVPAGSYIMLAVTDSGVGMAHETLVHIFEPFYTTKETGRGTGMGLATVDGIVHQLNGHIWVDSEPGRGSAFKIFLTHDGATSMRQRPLQQRLTVASGAETIMLVEDDTGVRLLTRTILQQRGFEVLECDAEVALQLAISHSGPIHLLLTDVVMPQISGAELAKQLLVVRPDLKVLYMSGYSESVVTQQGLFKAEYAFLQKPFTPETLVRKIRTVLDHSPGER